MKLGIRRTVTIGAISAIALLGGMSVSNAGPGPCDRIAYQGPSVNGKRIAGGEIVGTAGPDLIIGSQGADVIKGLAGNDTIFACGGADTIHGGAGADAINGGSGRDEMHGAAGKDRLDGSTGRDAAYGGPGFDLCGAETLQNCEGVIQVPPPPPPPDPKLPASPRAL